MELSPGLIAIDGTTHVRVVRLAINGPRNLHRFGMSMRNRTTYISRALTLPYNGNRPTRV